MSRLPIPSVRSHPRYHWFVVGTVCVGAFMAALDASIINIALPVLKSHFHVHMHTIEWVSLVYLLTLAGLIVPFGRIADMFGRRLMYAAGFTVFVVASACCGIAPSLSMLLVFRVVQAVGAAMLQANSVSIITAATPPHARGKAIGIQASAQGVGLSLGPAIGGALLSFLNWRFIFFVNIPVGIIGTLLGILMLPKDGPRKPERFDFAGALVLIPTLVSLIFCLNMGHETGWASPPVLISLAVFVTGLLGFITIERRVGTPMVDLKLFQNNIFRMGSITGVLSFAVMYAVLFLCPFYLSDVVRLRAFEAGLYLTAVPLGMAVLTPIAGGAADKFGVRLPTTLGMAFGTMGCLCLCLLGAEHNTWLILSGLFLVGAGLGLFTPPNNSSVMGSAPKNRLGVAGGILNMSRTLGMGLGVTIGGLCFQVFLAQHGVVKEPLANTSQLVVSFRSSYLIVAAIAALTLLLSLIKQQRRDTD